MFRHLQIYDRRDRWVVGLADAGLTVGAGLVRLFRRAPTAHVPPRRILVLRLERIGDLLMARPALAAVRRLAPEARIDLVVGSWNEPIAKLISDVDAVRTLDPSWLARGASAPGFAALLGQARGWRSDRYDLAINFEGDIRSHLLMACSGAPRRVGFDMAGGGPMLTDRVPYDPTSHVATNLLRLVEAAFPGSARARHGISEYDFPPLEVPTEARERAAALLAPISSDGPEGRRRTLGPLVGIQVSGGRKIKQWDPARFGDVAAELAATQGARLVFTGSADDRALVETAVSRVPAGVSLVDLCGRVDLVTLAAVIQLCSVLVTCDTGPMHLAAAVGTPVVAIFGPSDPRRWGPLSRNAYVIRAAECEPCNRIRRPPQSCAGWPPDCMAAVTVDRVARTAERALKGGIDADAGTFTVEGHDAGR